MKNQHCHRCDQDLHPDRIVWLELHNGRGTFHEPGTVPPENSQGEFPFGAACAQNQLKEDAS